MLKKILFTLIIVAILAYVGIIKINGTRTKEIARNTSRKTVGIVKKYVRTEDIKSDTKRFIDTKANSLK